MTEDETGKLDVVVETVDDSINQGLDVEEVKQSAIEMDMGDITLD